MLLKNVLHTLIRTELKNIAEGKPEWSNGNFSYVNLIELISQAYTELHKRFLIKKAIVKIVPIDTRTTYPLELQYAISDSTVADKFIYDSVDDPFPTNIVKIDTVLDKDMEDLPFNTATLNDPVIIRDEKTLFIREPDTIPFVYLVCRLLPDPLVVPTEADLDTYELDLSPIYLQALLSYAAGKAYMNRGAENATNNESAIFFARYEQSCSEIDFLGLAPKERLVNNKLAMRGFV